MTGSSAALIPDHRAGYGLTESLDRQREIADQLRGIRDEIKQWNLRPRPHREIAISLTRAISYLGTD